MQREVIKRGKMSLNILFLPVPDTVSHKNLLKYGNHQVKCSGNGKKKL
jgi:hypothetical protein